ncbi:MAG: diguanylate cyclase [Deltaproteobacteria bacterium]|nr:diguanylate cyclase [Deltaproteobacteria bacterium]
MAEGLVAVADEAELTALLGGEVPPVVVITAREAVGRAAFPFIKPFRRDHPETVVLQLDPGAVSWRVEEDQLRSGYDAAIASLDAIDEDEVEALRTRRVELAAARESATERRVGLFCEQRSAWDEIARGITAKGFVVARVSEPLDLLRSVRSGPVLHLLVAQHDLSEDVLDLVLAVQHYHAGIDCYVPVIEGEAQAALASLELARVGHAVDSVEDDGLGEFLASAWTRWLLGPSRGESPTYTAAEALKTLVVDDDDAVRRATMEAASTDAGVVTEGAASMEEALARIDAGGVDAVIVRLGLPDAPNIQSVLRLRVGRPFLPVVVLADDPATHDGRLAISAGAQDVLERGAPDRLLPVRLRDACFRASHLARAEGYAERLEAAEEKLRQLNVRLRLANTRLEQLASHDPLTGLLNRRGLEDVLLAEQARGARIGGPPLAALLDLDDFKAVNDRFGHHVGDEVLRRVAARLCGAVRPSDHCARIGGDEFLVLFPGADLDRAEEMAERLREAVSAGSLLGGGEPLSLSASVGIGGLHKTDLGLDEVLMRLRPGLRESKENGKDRVRVLPG